jgi:surfactin family lipopeptide synthetase C
VIADIYDMSPIQSGLYFHMLLDPGSGVYIEQLAFTLRGDLDVGAFRRAWDLLVRRHPMLRTSFHWKEVGKALQAVHPDVSAHVPVHDWTGVPAGELDARFAAHAAARRAQGFDLSAPPVMRTELLRISAGEHRFFWEFPHLVMDGWSFGLVFAEVAAAYAAFATGGEPQLPPARPYRDYVAWLRQAGAAADTGYWKTALAGYEPAPPLRIGMPGPAREPGQPGHDVLIDPALSEPVPALREFARAHGLTLNTVMQGAWSVLLSRYLGVADVVSGSTGTDRPPGLPGAETIVGPMLSTVPVRARPDPAARLVPWLRQLQESMAAGREHGAVPMAELRSIAGLAGEAELFDTDVAFENVPVPDLSLHGLDITDTWYDGRPHYAVTMILVPGGGLVPRIVHDRRRVPAAAARQLSGHFTGLLNAIAAGGSGDRAIGELEMISPADRRVLLRGPDPAAAGLWTPTSLTEVLARQAARRPAATAVSCGDHALSYADLDARSSQLARRLRELGARQGARVGLCLGRSADTVTAILGVLKSGAAYVPVELGQPADRMACILADAEASILVTHEAADGIRPDTGLPVVHLDRDAADLAARPAAAPEPAPGPDDLAYIIYTSGSTGRPKGVQVTHANVGWLVAGASQRFSLSESDAWSMTHSYAFDVSVFEMWGALWHGGRLVVAPRQAARSPDELLDLLRRERVTVFSQTPSAFRQFMLAALEGDRPAELPELRYVLFAGEYLDLRTLAPWLERYGDSAPELVNLYGITETTVHSTFRVIHATDLDSGVRSPVGPPLPHVGIYLLDDRGDPVPAGVPGEIWVTGPSVARGYQGLPDLTRDRFRDDPFAGGEARMYRSGDLARRLDDGGLEVLGRIDGQLKIRGYRIEPGEIEAVLREDPAVRDAAVIARDAGEGQLIAYVVTDVPEADEVTGRIAELARSRLPEYMVPAHVVPLDGLPLNASGKLDRRGLPEPSPARPPAAAAYAPPRTPAERQIAALWADVLGVERVGLHDDFFALGGHSLLAVRAAFRMRAELSQDIPVRLLFDHPTVAGLAAHLPGTPAAPPIERRARVAYQPEGSATG